LSARAISDLDVPSGRLLFFRGVHILGGARRSAGFRATHFLLRGPPRRVDDLLGDAVTMTLPKILAGMFDGDVEPLLGLITDDWRRRVRSRFRDERVRIPRI